MFITLAQLHSRVPSSHKSKIPQIKTWLTDKKINTENAFPILLVAKVLGSFEFGWVADNINADFKHKDMPRLVEALKQTGGKIVEKLPDINATEYNKRSAIKVINNALSDANRTQLLTAFYEGAIKRGDEKPAETAAPVGADTKAPAPEKPVETKTDAPAAPAAEKPAETKAPVSETKAPAPAETVAAVADNFDFAAFGRAVIGGIAAASGKTTAEIQAFFGAGIALPTAALAPAPKAAAKAKEPAAKKAPAKKKAA